MSYRLKISLEEDNRSFLLGLGKVKTTERIIDIDAKTYKRLKRKFDEAQDDILKMMLYDGLFD